MLLSKNIVLFIQFSYVHSLFEVLILNTFLSFISQSADNIFLMFFKYLKNVIMKNKHLKNI
jgi:hypothetical protein